MLGVIVLLFLSLPALMYSVNSPVGIAEGAALRGDDPFSTLLEVTNDGYVPLADVEFSYVMRLLETDMGGVMENCEASDPHFIPVLEAGKTTTISAGFHGFAVDGVEFADMEVVVTYTWKCVPWRWRGERTQRFRFVTVEDGSGELRWMKKALSE